MQILRDALTLFSPSPQKVEAALRNIEQQPINERLPPRTVEPLRGNGALGDKASMHHILAYCDPRCICYHRRSTWVEEFLVQWELETCTLGEALEQCRLGIDITSITNLDDLIPSQDLRHFVATK